MVKLQFYRIHGFLSTKLNILTKKIPYREWEEDGLLTVQDKPYIDYQDVLNWIIKMNEHYVVEKLLMIERTHSN